MNDALSSLEILKLIPQVKKDYLQVLRKLQGQRGDHLHITWPKAVHFFFHPDAVLQILKTSSAKYGKGDNYKLLEPLIGQSLLNSNGEKWRDQRKVVAPEFQMPSIIGFHDLLLAITDLQLTSWKEKKEINFSTEMHRLTFQMASQSFLGTELTNSADLVAASLEEANYRLTKTILFPLPWLNRLPNYNQYRINRCVHQIETLIYQLIEKRQKQALPSKDLISRLLLKSAATGNPIKEVRNQVITLLLAGHETTSLALGWFWYLLGKHDKIRKKVEEEILSTLGTRIPTAEDLSRLSFTRNAIEDSLRLYPSVPVFSRKVLENDVLAGTQVLEGMMVQVSPWITHRHPDFWEAPDEFNPDRFLNRDNFTPGSYFPFGLGPRECLGKNFALHQMSLIVARVLQKFKIEELLTPRVLPKPLITLHPSEKIRMRVRTRA